MSRLLIRFILTMMVPVFLFAQEKERWSYVYIQGDKQVPFYVKLEGEMMPRYGKNYSIIPRLAEGWINIEILFQQNQYSPLNYKIRVPEDGYRSFLLAAKDGVYMLYDIEKQAYLRQGTGEIDERVSGETLKEAVKPEPLATAANRNKRPKPLKKHEEKALNSKDPVFIDDLVLSNEHSASNPAAQSDPLEKSAMNKTEVPEFKSAARHIPNSDCPEAMDEKSFEDILHQLESRKEKDKLLAYLLKQTQANCFSTKQVYLLASQLESESIRFSFLQKAYSRVTDQEHFFLLEKQLFQTPEWREYFRLIQ